MRNLLCTIVVFLLVSCGAPPSEHGPGIFDTTQPILNGADVPTATAVTLGAVKLELDIGGGVLDYHCSGQVFNASWVLTAAHCINGGQTQDANHDGVIDLNEYAYVWKITNAPQGGGWSTRTADLLALSPGSIWDSSFGEDLVIVHVSQPMDTAQLSIYDYSWWPSGKKLNLFWGPTANLNGVTVTTLGYGAKYEAGQVPLPLNYGYKQLVTWSDSSGPHYNGFAVANAGTGCPGDSGGADFVWNSTYGRNELTGLHSQGASPCEVVGFDVTPSVESWRWWVWNTIP